MTATGRAINQQPLYDKLINAEVMLQQGDSKVKATVKRQTIGPGWPHQWDLR